MIKLRLLVGAAKGIIKMYPRHHAVRLLESGMAEEVKDAKRIEPASENDIDVDNALDDIRNENDIDVDNDNDIKTDIDVENTLPPLEHLAVENTAKTYRSKRKKKRNH